MPPYSSGLIINSMNTLDDLSKLFFKLLHPLPPLQIIPSFALAPVRPTSPSRPRPTHRSSRPAPRRSQYHSSDLLRKRPDGRWTFRCLLRIKFLSFRRPAHNTSFLKQPMIFYCKHNQANNHTCNHRRQNRP